MGILNGANWIECIDEDYLDGVITKPTGPRHVPINHGFALRMFRNKLRDAEIPIKREYGFLSPATTAKGSSEIKEPEGMKYMYAVETLHSFNGGRFTIGFVNFNNGKKSFIGLAGERVTVCSNEMVTGLIVESKRKHTMNARGELSEKMDAVIDKFFKFVDDRSLEIRSLQNTQIGKTSLALLVLCLHEKTPIAPSTIGQIIKEFREPQYDYQCGGSSLWDFQNACTTVFKKYKNPLYYMEHCQAVIDVIKCYETQFGMKNV